MLRKNCGPIKGNGIWSSRVIHEFYVPERVKAIKAGRLRWLG
jgi:hypothetical protein